MAYFTPAEARVEQPALQDKTDDEIEAMRLTVEEELEHECGVAFEPRTTTEKVSGDGCTGLWLSWPKIRTVTAIEVDGVAYTSSQLEGVSIEPYGGIYSLSSFTRGHGNVEVTYTHGYDEPPRTIRQAALILTKVWLNQGPIDDRATTVADEQGTTVYSTPGLRGVKYGIPAVDAAVQSYSMRTGIA